MKLTAYKVNKDSFTFEAVEGDNKFKVEREKVPKQLRAAVNSFLEAVAVFIGFEPDELGYPQIKIDIEGGETAFITVKFSLLVHNIGSELTMKKLLLTDPQLTEEARAQMFADGQDDQLKSLAEMGKAFERYQQLNLELQASWEDLMAIKSAQLQIA